MWRLLVSLLVTGLAACSSGSSAGPSPTGAATTAPSAPTAPTNPAKSQDVLSLPTIDGRFGVGSDGRHLAMRCFGHGAPVILFEAGDDSSGISAFPDVLVRPLAETNMTCLYDRIGTGSSDPPTAARRTLDDVVADTHALLAAANVPPPYVLVGQSGGGNIAVWYAIKHSDDAAALVLIDAGHDDPTAMAKEFGASFDPSMAGSEHIDWTDAGRLEWDLPTLGDIPVLILTADQSQPSPEKPSDWLRLSREAREVVEHGGHDLHQEIPDEVARQIRSVLDGL